MARHIPNEGYDAYFAYFSACTNLVLVSDESTPTDLTGALATATIDGTDFSISNIMEEEVFQARRLTIAAQNGIDVTATGTTNHAVLVYDPAGTPELRLITTCSARAVDHTAGDKVNMGEFYLQVAAPVAP